jgi:TPR repeat protein
MKIDSMTLTAAWLRRLAVTICAIAGLIGPAMAQTSFFAEVERAAEQGDPVAAVAVGDRAYNDRNFAVAAKWYERSLQLGQDLRLTRLAEIVDKGLGVPRNPQRAADLYRQAIDAWQPRAKSDQWLALEIGSLLRDGKGYPADPAKAMEWYGRSAGMGNAQAMLELGTLELKAGKTDDGIKHLKGSAQLGSNDALSRLGGLYYGGQAVPQDLPAALGYFEAAAKKGYVWDLVQIGDMYANGEGTAKDPATAAAWWKKAVATYPPIADANPYLYLVLANLYQDGKGVDRDEHKALQLMESAAEGGDPSARTTLASSNRPDPDSQALALKWSQALVDGGDMWMLERVGDLLDRQGKAADAAGYWKKAADFYQTVAASDARGAARLGNMYRKGKGVVEDPRSAIRWLTAAAAKSADSESEAALGEIYYAAGPDGYAQALKWYEASAGHGNGWVFEQIGDMYAGGQGTPVDMDKAQAAWGKAAAFYRDAASPWATYSLGELYAAGHGVPIDVIKAKQILKTAQDAGVAQAQAAIDKLDAQILQAANP